MADIGDAHSWPRTLGVLIRGDSLESAAAAWAMGEIISGSATDAQLTAFAVLLRAKGETPDELGGLARAMLARATPLHVPGRSVDVVGTGGDLADTVNISTMAALVVAGSGRQVVKHGNRSASSACGAADVLEELGVVIDLPADGVAATVAEVGIGFCFAPVFHPGMRFAGAPRREIGVPTSFNSLGPLTNPGHATAAAVGCADPRSAPVMAAVFAGRGDTALVVRGDDGLDELTVTTTSRVWLATGGTVTEAVFDPATVGIDYAPAGALRGGDRVHNATVVRDVLAGGAGPIRDAVLLNAAAAIAAFDGVAAGQLDSAIAAGIDEARRAVDSGSAAELLARWTDSSRRQRG